MPEALPFRAVYSSENLPASQQADSAGKTGAVLIDGVRSAWGLDSKLRQAVGIGNGEAQPRR